MPTDFVEILESEKNAFKAAANVPYTLVPHDRELSSFLIDERNVFKAAAEEATNNMRATVDAYAKLLIENVALKAEAEQYRLAHHALLDSIAHGAPVQAQIKPFPLNALRHSEPALPWARLRE